MAVNLSFIGGAGWQFFDNNGAPLTGGKLYTYAAGTSTPQVTYTSRSGDISNANPIILDSAGRTPEQIWSIEGLLYKYVIETADNVLIRSWDNIGGSIVASDLAQDLASTTDNTKGDALVGFKQSDNNGFLPNAVGKTVNDKLQEFISIKDFGAVGDGVTDDTAAIQAAANYCDANHKILFVPQPTSQYLITSTVNISCPFVGECAATGVTPGSIGQFVSRTNITVFNIYGSRLNIENIGIHFDLPDLATSSAVGFLFGNSTTQFSNNFVKQCYVRFAYNAFKTNTTGVGTVWNNTFVNCRSDLCQEYAWLFNALVGSTTQTWINCMNTGDSDAVLGGGWYIFNVDDVCFINCQSDSLYDGKAIFVNLATLVMIKNFRAEGITFRTNASALITCNATADISNVKLQASNVEVGAANRASVITLGASGGNGVIGAIRFEGVAITSGKLFHVDSNGLQFGNGYVTLVDALTKRADVRRDDAGNRTIFASKSLAFSPNDNNPTVGSYEVGDQLNTIAVSATRSQYAKLCITAGTAGTLTGVTASVTSGSTLVTVNTTVNIPLGTFITIAGISGVKRIEQLFSNTIVYIDTPADASVTTAVVAFSPPVFKVTGGFGIGTTGQRPAAAADDTGISYLDTTLNANGVPIFWNGTAWVNSTGAIV